MLCEHQYNYCKWVSVCLWSVSLPRVCTSLAYIRVLAANVHARDPHDIRKCITKLARSVEIVFFCALCNLCSLTRVHCGVLLMAFFRATVNCVSVCACVYQINRHVFLVMVRERAYIIRWSVILNFISQDCLSSFQRVSDNSAFHLSSFRCSPSFSLQKKKLVRLRKQYPRAHAFVCII